jgi:hypothetical protein
MGTDIIKFMIGEMKCAFSGHCVSDEDIRILNKKPSYYSTRSMDMYKSFSTNCKRCNHPILLQKERKKPPSIIEL